MKLMEQLLDILDARQLQALCPLSESAGKNYNKVGPGSRGRGRGTAWEPGRYPAPGTVELGGHAWPGEKAGQSPGWPGLPPGWSWACGGFLRNNSGSWASPRSVAETERSLLVPRRECQVFEERGLGDQASPHSFFPQMHKRENLQGLYQGEAQGSCLRSEGRPQVALGIEARRRGCGAQLEGLRTCGSRSIAPAPHLQAVVETVDNLLRARRPRVLEGYERH